jgi:hypothetical protein
MDEMTAVRELRAGAPLPDTGRLAAGRRRLMSEITAPGGRPAARRGLRPAAAAAAPPSRPRRYGVVVLTATAVAGLLLAAGVVMQDAGRPHPSGASSRPPSSAAGVLAAAASAADAAPAGRTPGAKQWLYTRTVRCQQRLCTTVDSWTRYGDGLRADVENPPADGSLPKRIDEYPGTTEFGWRPRADRAWLAALPEEPHALLARISSKDLSSPFPAPASYRSTQFQFRKVLDILQATQPTPPRYAAALYRALALIPGIEVSSGPVKDAAGRQGLAVGFRDTGEYLVLDPVTYAYRGVNWDLRGSAPLLRIWALTSSGVVDHAGQRPGGPVPPPSSVVVHHAGKMPGASLPPGTLHNYAPPPSGKGAGKGTATRTDTGTGR